MTGHTPGDDGNDDKLDTQPSQITYEIGEDEHPSEAVVLATASLTNTPVIELDPLYNVVDPEHLDGLFGGSGEAPAIDDGSVTFTFNGCHVTVKSGSVVVRDQS